MIANLHIKNFAASTELAIDFSPGINIVIGENDIAKAPLHSASQEYK